MALCGLTTEEVDAIAEHEHLPETVAAALGRYLLKRQHGPEEIRGMMVDDIRSALDAGHIRHASELFAVLRHFLEAHGPFVGSTTAIGAPGRT